MEYSIRRMSRAWAMTVLSIMTGLSACSRQETYRMSKATQSGIFSNSPDLSESALTNTNTLGNSALGTSTDTNNSNYINAIKFTMPNQAGTASSMSVFIAAPVSASPNNLFQVAVYSNASEQPGGLIARSASKTIVANAWNTVSISASLSAGVSYWLAYNTNGISSSANNLKTAPGSLNQMKWKRQSFGSWPSTFGAVEGASSTTASIYLTYTPAISASIVADFNSLTVGKAPPAGYPLVGFGWSGFWIAPAYDVPGFSTRSISTTSASSRVGSVSLPAGYTLVRFQASNGDTVSRSVSVSCLGNPTVNATVPARQLITINTGWTSSCNSATFNMSGGWSTDLDNLAFGTAKAPPSPTPSPTPSPRPSPTPSSTPSPTPIPTVTTTYSTWPGSIVPAVIDSGQDNPVELGVKFKSDLNGTITGIRFYKASTNTGTHVGNLWSSSGSLLASATFTGETASGWQQVNFSSPVAISANTVYVASYHTNVGHYSDDQFFFSGKGVDAPPLHLLADSASGANGVYAYGATSSFPNQGWNASNYWVDVIFSTSRVIPGPSPTPTGGAEIRAKSCEQPDVQYAITSAKNGDTVLVPGGNCIWSTPITLSKAITLQGAGVDVTNITGDANQEGSALSIVAHATLNTTIKGFTFNNTASQTYMGTIRTDGSYSNTGTIRITGNKFNTGSLNGFGLGTIDAYNNQALLIDHNTFIIAGSNPTETMHIMGDGAASWTRPDNFGSGTGQTIMEDNLFDASSNTSGGWALIFTSFDGARFTVRHNTFKNCYLDAHPNTWSHDYGVRQGEVYGNTFQGPARVLDWKAGTLVFFDNTVTAQTAATLHAPTLFYQTPSGACCCTSNLTSAACRQRPGFGANFNSDPMYFWNNTNISVATIDYDNAACDSVCGGHQSTNNALRPNIEYFVNSKKPGYVPYAYPHPLNN